MPQPETARETPPATVGGGLLGDWFSPGRFAALLALLIFATFPQVLLGLQTFVVRDYGFFAYPLAHFQREAFWRGELPLWNPYSNCGVPFLAQWNTMPLYPPALVYLLLPLNWSLSFFCLLHLWFAGFGAYLLARRWTGNDFAAAFAGVAFAFNGLSLNLLMWPSHIATFAWMPWVVLLVERAWREGGRMIFLAALAGAMQMLGGGPETILFTWLLLTALWVMDLWGALRSARRRRSAQKTAGLATDAEADLPLPCGRGEGRGEGKTASDEGALLSPRPLTPALSPSAGERENYSAAGVFLRFPLIVLLVAALAAAQLFPFLDLTAHSQREGGFADARWSMPAWGWANYLVPMVFGRVENLGVFFQYFQGWTSSYYLGTGALLLALLAALTGRERRVIFLATVGAVALLFAFGDQTFVVRELRRLIPQLTMMTYPVKYVLIVTFVAPLLGAFALARVQRAEGRGQKAESDNPPSALRPLPSASIAALGAVLLALIAAILLCAWRFPIPTDDVRATLLNGLTRAGFLIVSAGLLFLLAHRSAGLGHGADASGSSPTTPSWRRAVQFAPLLFLLVAWLDMLTHAPTQNPTIAPWIYEPGLARTKLAMQPQPALGESRISSTPFADKRFREFSITKGEENFVVKRLGYFADCNLLDDVPRVGGFVSLAPRECGELHLILEQATNVTLTGVMDFLGVSQIIAPEKYFEWEARPNFHPLITAGQRPIFLDDTNAPWALVTPQFDGGKIVFLPPEARALVTVTNQTNARITGWRFAAERVDFEFEADAASLAVVAQTFYHCWNAWVDDRPVPLLRANYAFQAVEVPAGKHRVRLVYEDRGFRIGAGISGVALVICLVGLAMGRRGRTRRD